MTQEQVIVEGNPTYIVALCDDLEDRLERANYTYTSARRPPLPRARPFLVGHATLTPLFDRVLGHNHIIKGRYEAGTVSALHIHDADQYLIRIGWITDAVTRNQSLVADALGDMGLTLGDANNLKQTLTDAANHTKAASLTTGAEIDTEADWILANVPNYERLW